MSSEVIGTRAFSTLDQRFFSDLSGDWNPVHVDGEYARRTMFGDVVVHGIHAVLWALDRYAAVGGEAPATLGAQFVKPIFLHETITLRSIDEGGTRMLVLSSDSVTLATVSLNPQVRASNVAAARATGWPTGPRALGREELARSEAELPFDSDLEALAAAFPSLARLIGSRACGTIMLLSRLVGMECPGKQSLFAGLRLSLERSERDALTYRVKRSEPAFAPVEMEFSGPDATGTVAAFFRPAEVAQPTFAELRRRVEASEFATTRALVVGGSRGLGEATAKLLAAGGAEVAVTYAVGASDAERVRREIVEGGGRCQVHQLDVLDPERSLAGICKGFDFDTAYYFATPRINGRRKAMFEPERLRALERYYVDAFADFCRLIGAATGADTVVFYPSTIFIDEHSRDNIEYAAAKAAGETLGAYLTSSRVVRVISKRLPRMATDQTAGIVQVTVAETVSVLLDAVREVNAAALALSAR